jgi:putative Ca2+/H+ antiporter (TMEM165/GDT1 family)
VRSNQSRPINSAPQPPHQALPPGAFISTLEAFFIAEIGDKTQIATVGLAARFEHFYAVVVGTTLGMVAANIPVGLIGDRPADKLSVKAIRTVAAIVFAALGVMTLSGLRL